MKKIMIILVVLVQTTLFAQSMQTIQKPLKLTSVAVGSITDDVLLIGTADQTAKKISVNSLLINKANLASPIFTGAPNLPTGTIATTQTAGNSTTAVATTAFVTTAGNLKANLTSPAFTGTPNLPTGTVATTQLAGNNSTAVATTAFVTTADNLKANLASPTFTGSPNLPTGTSATTQTATNNSTAVATTAFVQNNLPNTNGNWSPTFSSPVNCTLGATASGTLIITNNKFCFFSFSLTVTVTNANTLTSIRVGDPNSYTGPANALVGYGFAYNSNTNILPVMFRNNGIGPIPIFSFFPTAAGVYEIIVFASYKVN